MNRSASAKVVDAEVCEPIGALRRAVRSGAILGGTCKTRAGEGVYG